MQIKAAFSTSILGTQEITSLALLLFQAVDTILVRGIVLRRLCNGRRFAAFRYGRSFFSTTAAQNEQGGTSARIQNELFMEDTFCGGGYGKHIVARRQLSAVEALNPVLAHTGLVRVEQLDQELACVEQFDAMYLRTCHREDQMEHVQHRHRVDHGVGFAGHRIVHAHR